MHRWWGNSAESDKQAGERNSRAARRSIRDLHLNLSSDDEEDVYADCDTSGIFGGLDGNDDIVDEVDMDAQAAAAAAELARQRALPVEDSDFDNDPEAWKKELKLKFEPHDVLYWFNSVEAQMVKFGINSQWDKKDAILPLLPENVIEECKPMLRLSKAEAGPTIYKDLKAEIILLFGPRDEDAFKKAVALKMTSTPSAFGKRLINVICPGSKPMDGCHCARMIYGFWEAQLGAPIKSRLAGKKFNKDTYVELFKLADEAWRANGGERATPAVVAAVEVPFTHQSTLPPTDTPQVSATTRGGRGGRGGRNNRGGRGNRGQGRGQTTWNNTNQNQQSSTTNTSTNNSNPPTKAHQKGPKHPDLPSSAKWACAQHWKKGRGAPYCSDPLVCEWVNVVAPRQ